MDKMILLYGRYLNEICHCYADEKGNRPCDYGVMCDRCEQQQIPFNKWRWEQMFGNKYEP